MKLLREYIRELLTEAAKGPQDLPDGIFVRIQLFDDGEIDVGYINKLGEEFGTDVITSYGGNEYSNKRHNPKTTWSWNWSNISSSMKTSLENVRDSVQDHKKFLYYDETSYHYVRMGKPLEFTEVAYQRYSTNIKLREQLA